MTQLSPAQKLAMLKMVVGKARGYIGEEEVPIGSNWGPFVQATLAIVGLDEPEPWCMAFVVRCFVECGYLTVNGTELLIKTAGCEAQADHARSVGLLVSQNGAIAQGLEPGWVMLMWEAELGRYAHSGIVSRVDLVNKTFCSIEGNTNNDGGAEGYIVLEQFRSLEQVCSDGHPKYAFVQTA